MALPLEIRRIVAHYATGSVAEFKALVSAGVVDNHPLALSCLRLDFSNMVAAVGCIDAHLFAGVRRLKLSHTTNEDLASLVRLAPRVEALDLGRCINLNFWHTKLLSDLAGLRTLRMIDCQNLGAQLNRVRDLDLIRCSNVGGDLRSLRRLKLHHCVLSDVQFSSKLRYFHLNGYLKVDRPGWSLCGMRALCELHLTMCRSVTNEHASHIKHMQDLHTLTLLECEGLSDFAFLANLPKLRVLTVSSNFDWEMLLHLRLECFTAIGCGAFGVSGLHRLAAHSELRVLRVHGRYSDEDPAQALCDLLQCWPKLHTLDLSHWSHFLAKPRRAGLGLHPSVQRLTIDYCTWVHTHELLILAYSFPNLEALSAKRTRIGDECLSEVCELGLKWRELCISGCVVTDQGLSHLQGLPNLTRLGLSECDIRRADLLPLSITELDVTRCTKLDPHSLQTLRARQVNIVM